MHVVMDEAPEQEETPTPEAEPAAATPAPEPEAAEPASEPEAAAPAPEPEAAAPAPEPEAAAPAPEPEPEAAAPAPEPGVGPAVDEAAPAEPAPAASGAAPVGAALPDAEAGAAPAEGDGGPAKKRRRRRKGSKVAEQWGVSATKAKEIAHKVERPKPSGAPSPRRGRNRMPREKGPLPFQELRSAAEAIMKMEGERKALRDAVGELAERERNELGDMVRGDGDFRQRARSISAGSLAAGKLGKALAAQQVAIADIQDLWSIMLSKEEAAERLARVRRAKNRDRDRAKRNEERASRSDRVSREDLQKAQDGRVGAQIRFVIAGEEKRDRRKKDEEPEKKTTANDLLDRLGY